MDELDTEAWGSLSAAIKNSDGDDLTKLYEDAERWYNAVRGAILDRAEHRLADRGRSKIWAR